MDFCDECGSMMKSGPHDGMVCPSCGYETGTGQNAAVNRIQAQKKQMKIELEKAKRKIERASRITVSTQCPHCDCNEAKINLEGKDPDAFLRCVDCGYQWGDSERVTTCPECGYRWKNGSECEIHRQPGEDSSPVKLGGNYELQIMDKSTHHSGDIQYFGKHKGFSIFLKSPPDSVGIKDNIEVKITSFTKDGQAANAKYIQHID